MSTEHNPHRILGSNGLFHLLGLRGTDDAEEWGRLRATQLTAGRQLALFLFGANLLCVGMIAILFADTVDRRWLMAWSVIAIMVGGGVTVRRRAFQCVDNCLASIAEVRATAIEGAALAAVWSVPPYLFDPKAGPTTVYGAWLILSLLMTAAAVAMAPLTLGAIVFVAGVSAAVVLKLLLAGAFIPAAATTLFAALLGVICVSRARALVMIKASELALDERDETVSLLLREFEENGADWLWETDVTRCVIKASPRFAYACGQDPVTINGMPFLQLLAGPTWEDGSFSSGLRQLADKLKARESFRDLRLPVHVRGEERWWEMAASPRYDDRGQFVGFRGVSSDVTEQRASADKINRMARFDTLTGLPNRLLINETLVRAITEAEKWGGRCAFMMIDLDRFKAINDTLGHPIGDRLLSQVSERLSNLIIETGKRLGEHCMCGRLGGDEFAVVVPDGRDLHAIEALAHQIIQSLSRPYEVDQHTLYISASVGLAVGPRDGRTAEMLIRSADLALYRSKDAGGGIYHAYEPQLHVQAEERRVLEMALRTALDRGELHLAYQPVVDSGTGQLTGFEALLRWSSAEFGNVSPVKFIPIAEEARLIAPIGEWVVRTACLEAATWPRGLRIAVNVSAEQLVHPGFFAIVSSALATAQLPPDQLELEVTESVFLHEGLSTTKVLDKIIDLGVRLSLDDFGTGYSSLGYLSRTRFSSIKIDRSFVQGASKGVREAIAIIRAVVALAKSLGMATTAEGVETEAEHRMVQELGCTKVQGYYFGRPLPVEEARALADQSENRRSAA